MRTLINNTYIRITLPTPRFSCILGLFFNALKELGRIVIKIDRFPNKHPFYYIEEEKQYRLDRDRIRAESPWL